MTLVFLAPDRNPVPSLATAPAGPGTAATRAVGRPGDEPQPSGHRPGLVIAAHISAACVTILLAVLAAIGSA